ncbi:MAG: ferredoxin [Candidatus Woesearchaeota archaeon]
MKVKISDDCIGCGACVAISSDIFVLNKGKAEVIKQPQTSKEEEAVKNAAELCPSQAIEIE